MNRFKRFQAKLNKGSALVEQITIYTKLKTKERVETVRITQMLEKIGITQDVKKLNDRNFNKLKKLVMLEKQRNRL